MTENNDIQTHFPKAHQGSINIEEIDSFLISDNSEIKKAEARAALERRLPMWYADYIAQKLYEIAELWLVMEDGKWLWTALWAIKEMNDVMWIKQQNKVFTIQSNVPTLSAEQASKH
jgi:hypothetical protein